MSKYTITIKNLIKNGFDFGLNDYPIFDENYRNILNQKILYHYYENEIGLETPELFKFYLNQKLREIMPYYNIMYKKQNTLIDNLDYNVNLTETLDRTNSANTVTNNTGYSTSNNKNLFLDTPQGNLSTQNIDDDDVYVTNLTLNRGNVEDNTTSTGDTNGTENYVKSIIGNNGSKYGYEILNDIKNNILNIDMMIIDDLNELFIGLF